MYPTAVIILVKTRCSIMDVCESSPSIARNLASPVASEACPATLGHLSFAAGPVHSMTDNEAEAQCSSTLWSQGGREHGLEKVILEKDSQVAASE
jgi:hypothetical protein